MEIKKREGSIFRLLCNKSLAFVLYALVNSVPAVHATEPQTQGTAEYNLASLSMLTTIAAHYRAMLRVGGSDALIDALFAALSGLVDEKALAASRQYIAEVRKQ